MSGSTRLITPSQSFQAQTSNSFSEAMNGMIAPQVTELLHAGEAEFHEKENHLADAESLCRKAEIDLQAARNKIRSLCASIEDGSDSRLENELDGLIRESEALTEQLQHRAIHELVRTEEGKAVLPKTVNGANDEQDMLRKASVAMQLHEEQEARKGLVENLVLSRANEGMQQTGEQCKALVANILRVPEAEVNALIPEVLSELEIGRDGTLPS
jgi:hypothetical protein